MPHETTSTHPMYGYSVPTSIDSKLLINSPLETVGDREHALLNEFKMAAQSLIEVWSEGEKVEYPEELQKHIDWFKELLG
jgi:hypothetical protein